MLSFVLCDDNKAILDRLSKMLETIFIGHNIDAEVSLASTNPQDVLDYLKRNVVNVLFLDIDLKSTISGLDLADIIRKFNKEVYIVFTSAHLEYILLAYKCKTFDFIPKPISIERVEETIIRLMDDINYVENMMFKLNTYERNGIYLGVNLFITHETSKIPLNTRTLDGLIRKLFCTEQ